MFWPNIQFKLGEVGFFLGKMRQSVTPARDRPELQGYYASYSSPGTTVVTLWQPQLYYYFDAFLAATRSIPDIIQAWYGWDARVWQGKQLPPWERDRRKQFQEKFRPLYTQFSEHPLSRARNITVHRGGTPPVEVKVTGRWGVVYEGDPTQHIRSTEIPPEVARRDPTVPMGPVPISPLEPAVSDFLLRERRGDNIHTYPLFSTCEEYKNVAYSLVEETQKLITNVHGDERLTPPPQSS